MSKQRFCQFCKKNIPPGSTFFESRIQIISGYDGCLPETDCGLEGVVREVLKGSKEKSAEELMEDVYQEFQFVLCNDCRLLFREKLQALMGGKGKILPFTKK
jgi:hypothetical protein